MCTGGRAYSNGYFGTGSGPIFLDDVQCSSSFNQLLKCSSRRILSNDCLHSADAGVGCEGMLCSEVTNAYILTFCYPANEMAVQPLHLQVDIKV